MFACRFDELAAEFMNASTKEEKEQIQKKAQTAADKIEEKLEKVS